MPTRRILGVLIAIVLSAALAGPVAAVRPPARVAVIVGPAGELTDLYRSIGAAAAREARRWTPDVISVMTPDATWPVVRRALRGASVVIYLGHGNGFPSPYRKALHRTTQNGLGLNPIAGRDDTAHQYFGEAFLAREVRLAPGAVVLLHHLCYASGNSEPGLAEGSLDVGQERVDGYAAGWLAAGAGAVIADTFGSPGPYLQALFGTDQTVDRIWRSAPTFHDHVLGFASARTPGFQAAMDPTRPASGFNRSLVVRPGLTAADMRAGAGRVATLPVGSAVTAGDLVGSLAALGVRFRAPSLVPASADLRSLVTGSQATLDLPVALTTGSSLPTNLQLGVRWDPIAVDPAPSPSPSVDPTPTEPPPVDPVVAEVQGSIVTTARARLIKSRLRVSVQLPLAAGIYRLVTTVHGADGIAFDAATQVLIPAVTVRVSRPLSVAYGVVSDLHLPAGAATILPVRVANDGILTWADAITVPGELIEPSVLRAHPPARLIGRWIPLGVGQGTDGVTDPTVTVAVPPGGEVTVLVPLVVPTSPGDYLLVFDVNSPRHGSLAAQGVPLGQVRLTVDPVRAPIPVPDPIPVERSVPGPTSAPAGIIPGAP